MQVMTSECAVHGATVQPSQYRNRNKNTGVFAQCRRPHRYTQLLTPSDTVYDYLHQIEVSSVTKGALCP